MFTFPTLRNRRKTRFYRYFRTFLQVPVVNLTLSQPGVTNSIRKLDLIPVRCQNSTVDRKRRQGLSGGRVEETTDAQQGARGQMRLLSYNIHKGIGGRDRRYKLERIIEVIEHENPDFICLQEVDRHVRRSKYHDQPRLLAEYFHSVGQMYQLNVHLKEGGYGNLLLSRWPLKAHHQVSLTYQGRKARGAQIALIDTPEGPLHLINWHLGLAERMRQWQVRHLLHHPLFRESDKHPTLIIGDFNDWRNTLARKVFQEHGFSQVTTPPRRFRSFPAYWPMGSLDKAFLRGEIHLKQAHVVRTPMAKKASDHLPLVLDFHLAGAMIASPSGHHPHHATHSHPKQH
ncbi:MAG: endonuclease/exonuclease/phosphatase family protein [Planctomycetales bacterium]